MNLDRKAACASWRGLPIHPEKEVARGVNFELPAAADENCICVRLQLSDQGSSRSGGDGETGIPLRRTAYSLRTAALFRRRAGMRAGMRVGGNFEKLSCLQVYSGVRPGLRGRDSEGVISGSRSGASFGLPRSAKNCEQSKQKSEPTSH